MKAHSHPAPGAGFPTFLLVGILLLALIVRLAGLPSRGLWYDELRSVTYAILPVGDLLTSVRVFDPHPPLYYLQLHFWMLFGTGDEWVKLNSVVWSMLALISLYYLCLKQFDRQTALLAALLFALSPYAVFYAQEARMYSLLMFLGVWSFFFTYRWILYHWKWDLLGSLLFSLAFLYSHGAGFIWLVSLGSFAVLFWIAGGGNEKRAALLFGLLQLLVVALYIPWLVRAAQVTHIEHTWLPSLQDGFGTLFTLLFGAFQRPFSWRMLMVVLLVLAGIAAASVRNPAVRFLVVSFLLVPMGFAAAISYLYRPIWLPRLFAYLLPFLSIILALTIREISGMVRIRRLPKAWVSLAAIGGSGLALAAGLVWQQTTYSYPWNIPAAVAYVRQNAAPGGVIYVPNERLYWAAGWYLAGPGKVNPLTTDYLLILQNGLQFLSNPSIGEANNPSTTWILYRPGDGTAPFETWQLEPVAEFNQLVVARVQK